MRGFIAAGTFTIILATTGLAARAEGDPGTYAYETLQQTRAQDYSTQFDQNGQGIPRWSLGR